MNSLIYAGAVGAGAVTLLIEAWRTFNHSLSGTPFRRFAILSSLKVNKLCTAHELRFGMLIYCLPYLMIYVLALGSSEIYELLISVDKNNLEVGPTSKPTAAATTLGELFDNGYSKPIYISAAIISLFSIGGLKPIESTMRSLAQRIAGVPRGIYKVIEDLHSREVWDFSAEGLEKSDKDTEADLVAQLFREKAERKFLGSENLPEGLSARHSEDGVGPSAPQVITEEKPEGPSGDVAQPATRDDLHSGENTAPPLEQGKVHPALRDDNGVATHFFSPRARLREIKHALYMIDCLSVTITNKSPIQYFPLVQTQTETMTRLSEKIADQKQKLCDELERWSDKENVSAGDRASLNNQILSLEDNVIAVFAVFFLRNNRAIKNAKKDSKLHKIAVFIKRSYRLEQNALAIAFFLAFFLSFIWSAGMYYYWNYQSSYNKKLEGKIEQIIKGNLISGKDPAACIKYLKNRVNDASKTNRAKDTGKDASGDVPEEHKACKNVLHTKCKDAPCLKADQPMTPADIAKLKQTVEQELKKTEIIELTKRVRAAFWNTITIALAITPAMAAAIFSREVRREEGSWEEWELKRTPVLRIAALCFIPAVLAVIGITTGEILDLLFKTGFQPSENQLATLFELNQNYFAMHAIVGFFVAFGVIYLADRNQGQSGKLPMRRSIRYGMLYGCLTMAFYYLASLVSVTDGKVPDSPPGFNIPFLVRETLIDGSFPFLILVIFSIYVNRGVEKKQGASKKTGQHSTNKVSNASPEPLAR